MKLPIEYVSVYGAIVKDGVTPTEKFVGVMLKHFVTGLIVARGA